MVSYALKQRLRGDREGFVQLLSVGETEALVWSLLDYFRMKTEMRQELFKVSKSFWGWNDCKIFIFWGIVYPRAFCSCSRCRVDIVSFNFPSSVFPFRLAFSFSEFLFSLSLLPLLSVFLSSLAAARPCTKQLLCDSHLHIPFNPPPTSHDKVLFCFTHKRKYANFFG